MDKIIQLNSTVFNNLLLDDKIRLQGEVLYNEHNSQVVSLEKEDNHIFSFKVSILDHKINRTIYIEIDLKLAQESLLLEYSNCEIDDESYCSHYVAALLTINAYLLKHEFTSTTLNNLKEKGVVNANTNALKVTYNHDDTITSHVDIKYAQIHFYDATISRGAKLFYNNQAKFISYDYLDKNRTVTAKFSVLGSNIKPYNTTLKFQVNKEQQLKLTSTSCTCPVEYQCKHAYASLLAFEEYLNDYSHDITDKTFVSKQTSPVIKHLESLFLSEIIAVEQKELYELVPIFEVDHEILLRFKIGKINQKQLVVKDIYELADLFTTNTTYEYGIETTVVHNLNLFKNQEFVKEILELIKVNQRIIDKTQTKNRSSSWYNSYSYTPALKYDKKQLSLSPTQFEYLLSLLENQQVHIKYLDERLKPMSVVKSSIKPQINIIRNEESYEVSVDKINNIYLHENGLYIFENKLFITHFTNNKSYHFLDNVLGDKLVISLEDAYDFNTIILDEIKDDFEIYSEIILDDTLEISPVIVSIDTVVGDLEIRLSVNSENIDKANFNKKQFLLIDNLLNKYKISNYYFVNEESVLHFIETELDLIYELADEVLIDEAFTKIKVLKNLSVSLTANITKRGLELELLSTEFEVDELSKILQSFHAKKEFHKLNSGAYIKLDDEVLVELNNLFSGLNVDAKEIVDNTLIINQHRSLYLDYMLEQSRFKFKKGHEFKNLVDAYDEHSQQEFIIPDTINAILRPYQIEGYNWLQFLRQYHLGGILADDMGLGKTLQVIVLLSANKSDKPSIVVAPASLGYNWQKELEKFCPSMKSLVYTGSKNERYQSLNQLNNYDLIITSYDVLRRDIDELKDIEFDYAILDEAQYIKNHSTQIAKSCKLIKSDYKLALTGTPIENSLAELWSIFDFLMPNYLLNNSKFRQKYEKPIIKEENQERLEELKQIVSPFILRRLKKDVLKDLPDKIEQTIYVKLEDDQRAIYDSYVLELKSGLLGKSESELNNSKLEVLMLLNRLRQLCCNPRLVDEIYPDVSAKLETVLELIHELKDGGHKIIVFSQFTSNFSYIKNAFDKEGITYMELTGKTNKNIRHQMVHDFNNDDTNVFLISLKAGGTGLNITGADTVIHFDPWWNVSAENQATDRAYRIGQKNTVTVYKIIAENTIEEKIVNMQIDKKEVADAILENNETDIKKMSKNQILDLFT